MLVRNVKSPMGNLFLRIVVIVDVVDFGFWGETKLGRKKIDNFLSPTCR